MGHPNERKYSNQRIWVVRICGYAHVVPFVETEDEIFLKTIMPSRKATRQFPGEVDNENDDGGKNMALNGLERRRIEKAASAYVEKLRPAPTFDRSSILGFAYPVRASFSTKHTAADGWSICGSGRSAIR